MMKVDVVADVFEEAEIDTDMVAEGVHNLYTLT